MMLNELLSHPYAFNVLVGVILAEAIGLFLIYIIVSTMIIKRIKIEVEKAKAKQE